MTPKILPQDYWRKLFPDGVAPVALALDRPRPPVASYVRQTVRLELHESLSAGIRSYASEHHVALPVLLLAVFKTVLFRCSGQEAMVVGAALPQANARTGGMATTLLPVHSQWSPVDEISAVELAGRLAQQLAESATHAPALGELRELIGIEDAVFGRRLFSTALCWDTGENPGGPMSNPDWGEFLSSCDVVVVACDSAPARLVLTADFDCDLFDPSSLHRLFGHMRIMLEGIVARPATAVLRLPLLLDAEREQLLVEWQEPRASYATTACIHQLVEEQVERTPDAIAVSFGTTNVTYRQLNEQANQVARSLIKHGVEPGDLVAVLVERSPEMIVSILATWKAGGAYVPIDPDHPLDRIRFLLEDSQARCVLTRRRFACKIAVPHVRILFLDEQSHEHATPPSSSKVAPKTTCDRLAYVIYTSGSTGQPKGVCVTQWNLLNLVCWHHAAYAIGTSDRATLFANPAFDASVWEVWPYLITGASLHIPDDEVRTNATLLVRWLADEKITIAFLPTPLTEEALKQDWPERTTLRELLTGGDRLHRPPPPRLPFRLINHYGPTENTVVSTCGVVEAGNENHGAPSIGRPLPNVRAYILDRLMQPVPIGVPGELCVGGAQVARGYWNRPELTAEKFVPDPFSGEPGARMYRTGDRCRWLPDGKIDFLGRIDEQIKIRGIRIEPGEIEAALRQHASVCQAAVIAHDNALGDKRLTAYLVPSAKPVEPTVAELRLHLGRQLPDYMLPSAFVWLERMPLTPNGKIDRTALPPPASERQAVREFVAPSTPAERLLAGIWREVLGVERIGVNDDFFELGGHSLLATQVGSRVWQALRWELPLRLLFAAPTVAKLAALIEKSPAKLQPDVSPAVINGDVEEDLI